MIFIFLGVMILFFIYIFRKGHKNTQNIVLNHIRIEKTPSENNDTLLKVLQISDMHLENISISPEELYETLKNEPIDLIALTGDYMDRKSTLPKIEPYLDALNKLQPKYGAYAVFGNHDYVLRKANFDRLKVILNQSGFKTLQNENDRIEVNGMVINIIGIDNYGTKHSDLEKSYEDLEEGYNLVLTHDPNIVLEMESVSFDYLMSGHFHGGQICYPKPFHLVKMGKLARMKIIKGLHYLNGQPYYISEGLGQTGLNIRFGSLPEITIHHLQIPVQSKTISQEKVS